MSCLFWMPDDNRGWLALPLPKVPLEIGDSRRWRLATEEASKEEIASALEKLTAESVTEDGNGSVRLIPIFDQGSAEVWGLVWGSERKVSVNGQRLRTGFRLMETRDEIRVDTNKPVYFSNESLARVEKFEGGGRELMCPRCKKRIEDNASVVRCPNPKCMVLHHEEDDLNCWTYSPTCAMCSQPTNLDAGFQWVPDESCG